MYKVYNQSSATSNSYPYNHSQQEALSPKQASSTGNTTESLSSKSRDSGKTTASTPSSSFRKQYYLNNTNFLHTHHSSSNSNLTYRGSSGNNQVSHSYNHPTFISNSTQGNLSLAQNNQYQESDRYNQSYHKLNKPNMILSTSHMDAASAYRAETLVATENDEDATVKTTTSSFKDQYQTSDDMSHSHEDSENNTKNNIFHFNAHNTSAEAHPKRPLVLFSIDISNWPGYIQSIVLIGGLIVFMCLYGYYQELVIYGWFNRKLSLFSTFLHFLGCSVFAQLQRHVTSPPTMPVIPLPSPQGQHNTAILEGSDDDDELRAKQKPLYRHILDFVFSPIQYIYRFCFSKSVPHYQSVPHAQSPTVHHTTYYNQHHASYAAYCYHSIKSFFRMGTAPTHIAVFYITLLVLTKTFAQGLSNLSMSQMNYPAKVLFKSANPIVTMFIGVVWMKKTYPLRDYLVVILLIIGLYIFITDASQSVSAASNAIHRHINKLATTDLGTKDLKPQSIQHHYNANNAAATTSSGSPVVNSTIPESTPLGIVYVLLSMIGSAGVPMIQEYCITSYHASIEDLIYYSFVGSTLISLLLSLIFDEFFQGLYFIFCTQNNHILYTIWIFVAFCSFGFTGANFSTAITAHYGALLNGIANTFRKAVTIGISFVMFPERNVFTLQKGAGTVVFFLGLLIKIFSKTPATSPSGGSTGGKVSRKEDMWETMKRSISMPSLHSLGTSETDSYKDNNRSRDEANSHPASFTGWWTGIKDGFASILPYPTSQRPQQPVTQELVNRMLFPQNSNGMDMKDLEGNKSSDRLASSLSAHAKQQGTVSPHVPFQHKHMDNPNRYSDSNSNLFGSSQNNNSHNVSFAAIKPGESVIGMIHASVSMPDLQHSGENILRHPF